MMEGRNPNARRGDDAGSGCGRPLDPLGGRKGRLCIAVVILALLGGLLAARIWWPTAGQPPEERHPGGLSPVPIPVLPAELDPGYRATMKEALEAARRVVESFPNDAEATAVVAMMHYYPRDKAGEEACWRRCLELDSGFSRAYEGLAKLASDDGDYAEAEATIRRAMAAGCNSPRFPRILGDALMRQGKLEEAASVLENEVRAAPRSAAVRISLGQVYQQLGEYEKAREQFEGALLISPTSTRAYHGLAGAFAKLGLDDDAEKSRAEFERLKALEKEADRQDRKTLNDELMAAAWVADTLTFAAKVYLAHQWLEDGERYLLRAVALDPKDVECRETLSSLYDRQGRYEDALQMVGELRDLEPGNLTHHRNLGILQGRLGHLEAAEETFRELCRRAPQEAVGYAGLAEIYLRAGKALPQAKALASEAVRLQPTAWNYTVLATICSKDGDTAGARAATMRAAELDPDQRPLRKIQGAVPRRP